MANPNPQKPRNYCRSCNKVIQPNTHACPHCGFRTPAGQRVEMGKGKTLEQLATWDLHQKTEGKRGQMPRPHRQRSEPIDHDFSLTADFIGSGKYLFHISLMADSFDNPTLHLVAADSADEAQATAQEQYAGIDFDPTLQDGYKIGEFN